MDVYTMKLKKKYHQLDNLHKKAGFHLKKGFCITTEHSSSGIKICL